MKFTQGEKLQSKFQFIALTGIYFEKTFVVELRVRNG